MPKTGSRTVIHVDEGSPAHLAGIVEGDIIVSVNGHRIRDELDLIFYSQEPVLDVRIRRDGKLMRTVVEKDEFDGTGIELGPMQVKRCRNNCIFCFVHQLPRGLRRTLYVKDEDYRLSFLYGNYVTLSSLTDEDRNRIVEQRLSPLYVSVHTTNPALRREMLGNGRATDIMDELRFLAGHRIRFHTQIVLCPGINDGAEMEKTITDLARLHPFMMSIAVVPVGLTRHRRRPLNPVTGDDARKALETIDRLRKRFLRKFGDPLVYGADELYLRAGMPMPPVRYYGDFPQIENGVGMVAEFLHQCSMLRLSEYRLDRAGFITFTGTSFHPFLVELADAINSNCRTRLHVVPVENRFFGESVTVAGLLTGRDIIRAVADVSRGDVLLLPDVVLRDSDEVLLDDVTTEDISEALSMEVKVIDSSPAGLLKGMEAQHED